MKIRPPKKLAEMFPASYTLTPAERAPIDAAIVLVAQTEQQAQGMVRMLINIHQLRGEWRYDREAGKLIRVSAPTELPVDPAKEGETK